MQIWYLSKLQLGVHYNKTFDRTWKLGKRTIVALLPWNCQVSIQIPWFIHEAHTKSIFEPCYFLSRELPRINLYIILNHEWWHPSLNWVTGLLLYAACQKYCWTKYIGNLTAILQMFSHIPDGLTERIRRDGHLDYLNNSGRNIELTTCKDRKHFRPYPPLGPIIIRVLCQKSSFSSNSQPK